VILAKAHSLKKLRLNLEAGLKFLSHPPVPKSSSSSALRLASYDPVRYQITHLYGGHYPNDRLRKVRHSGHMYAKALIGDTC